VSPSQRQHDGDDEVFEIYPGTIYERGRDRHIYGVYSLRDRGMDTACLVWSGNYRGDEPVIRTYYTAFTPRGLIKRKAGVKGRLYATCGHNVLCTKSR
jgi:hypothetical protein